MFTTAELHKQTFLKVYKQLPFRYGTSFRWVLDNDELSVAAS